MAAPNYDLAAAAEEAEARYAAANPKSAARHAAARLVLPGGNTRSVLHYDPFPVTLTRGAGARLWDLDGHEYLDFLGEYTAGLYGHSNPVIAAAVEAALRSGIVLGGPNAYEVELARLVTDRFPAVDQVRFSNSGTEANLMVLGAARAFTGRDKILVFDGAYHGGVLTFGAGGGAVNAPYPHVLAPYNDTDATLDLLRDHGPELAAVLIEPMMGAGGGIAAGRDFLAALRDETRRQGILLIFDEVMTSRLAPGGMQGKLGLAPDLTSFGKYLGGGLTFGAFGGRAEIMAGFDPTRPGAWSHAGTFNNNPLTMAAGVAGLTELFPPAAAETLNARGDRLRQGLVDAGRARGVPLQVLGLGSILALHFQSAPVRQPADTAATAPAARTLFHLEMLARGFYLARRGFMSLSLALTDDDCDAFVAAADAVLAEHAAVLR